jgi:hypothetical protein
MIHAKVKFTLRSECFWAVLKVKIRYFRTRKRASRRSHKPFMTHFSS